MKIVSNVTISIYINIHTTQTYIIQTKTFILYSIIDIYMNNRKYITSLNIIKELQSVN